MVSLLGSDGSPSPELITVSDYERAAAQRIEPGAYGYYVGGAADEITLADNVAAWRRLAIRPRVLVGVGDRDPSVTLLGRLRPHPLIVAPMAYQGLAHPEGEIATAKGARDAGAVMCMSTFGTNSPASVAQAVPDGSRWFQLYVFSDRGVSRELVAQATDHGYEALVVTVDLPVEGKRERDLRSGVTTATGTGVTSAAAAGGRGPMTPAEFAALVDPNLNWTDIERLTSESSLPVLLKGILTPEDAALAADYGAAGIVVSNHGGRQLDTVLSGADALASIADVAGDRVEVLVDGGIRRGTDVLKALALGARAVMVGRPVLWGLAVGGADGARGVLDILLAELDVALALAGARHAEDLDRSFLAQAPWANRTRRPEASAGRSGCSRLSL
jgi:4-hydroxymandelate oxidase